MGTPSKDLARAQTGLVPVGGNLDPSIALLLQLADLIDAGKLDLCGFFLNDSFRHAREAEGIVCRTVYVAAKNWRASQDAYSPLGTIRGNNYEKAFAQLKNDGFFVTKKAGGQVKIYVTAKLLLKLATFAADKRLLPSHQGAIGRPPQGQLIPG